MGRIVHFEIPVKNVDETITKITQNGGQIAIPKMAVPGIGWLVYFKDLDGHIVGAMQADPNAK